MILPIQMNSPRLLASHIPIHLRSPNPRHLQIPLSPYSLPIQRPPLIRKTPLRNKNLRPWTHQVLIHVAPENIKRNPCKRGSAAVLGTGRCVNFADCEIESCRRDCGVEACEDCEGGVLCGGNGVLGCRDVAPYKGGVEEDGSVEGEEGGVLFERLACYVSGP
jgi:hypothetical protein